MIRVVNEHSFEFLPQLTSKIIARYLKIREKKGTALIVKKVSGCSVVRRNPK